MGFLAPVFLFAALAVAVPFWLHRLRVQSADREPFSSAMFLESTEEQVHVRKRLRYLALLALRVLLLVALAVAFAKPVWERATAGVATGAAGTRLIVLDTSASMARAGVFPAAQATATALLDAAPADALVRVLTAPGEFTAAADGDRAAQSAAIDAAAPGSLRLDFGQLMRGIDALAQDLPPPVEVHLVSDFQASGLPAHFRDLASERLTALRPHPVAGEPLPNRRVADVARTPDGIGIALAFDGTPEQGTRLTATLNGASVGTFAVAGEPGEQLEVTGLAPEPGDNRFVAALEGGDAFAPDDRFHFVLENTPPRPIPVITAARGLPGVTYLAAALEADKRSGHEADVLVIGEADFRTLARFRWAIVEDLGAVDSGLAATLGRFVEDGGNLLAFAGQRTRAAATLPVTGHTVRPAAAAAAGPGFLAVAPADARHPVVAASRGWHTVNVSMNIAIEPAAGDEVLLRLADGTPFLVEQRRGRGRILLVTGGLDTQWNDLPQRPVFVGFLVQAARYLSGVERVGRAYRAGDVLPLDLAGGRSGQVMDPAGRPVLSLGETTRAQRVRMEQPGFYEVYTPDETFLVAVNVDPRESQFAVIDAATLERWVGAVGAAGGPAPASGPRAAPPAVVELWPVALLLLALLLIAESIVGDVYFRPRARG